MIFKDTLKNRRPLVGREVIGYLFCSKSVLRLKNPRGLCLLIFCKKEVKLLRELAVGDEKVDQHR